MRIRDGFKAIPAALQRQILRRGLMGCAFLLFSVVFLLMGYDALLVLPGVGFMLFSFTSAVWLFHIADRKRYVIVEGICAEVTKSILFKRVKTVTLEADGKILTGAWHDGCWDDGVERRALRTTPQACGFK